MCSTWRSGKALARFVGGPEFDSGHNLFLFASFLFFSSFFYVSFPLVFIAKGAPCEKAELEKNGETCKNLPWVFQIFKLDVIKWRIRE